MKQFMLNFISKYRLCKFKWVILAIEKDIKIFIHKDFQNTEHAKEKSKRIKIIWCMFKMNSLMHIMYIIYYTIHIVKINNFNVCCLLSKNIKIFIYVIEIIN